jgi:hypothetical protein
LKLKCRFPARVSYRFHGLPLVWSGR